MRIAFTEPSEWIDELKDCVDEGDQVSCVRLAVEKIPGERTETVLLFGTFMTEELLMELVALCGENELHLPQGTQEAERLREEIKGVCGELGVKVRGGRIDLGL